MKAPALLVLLSLLIPLAVLAGPNAGGTLFVHNTGLIFGARGDTVDWCNQGTPPATCALASTEIDDSTNTYRVWKVYAAFDSSSSPRLKALDFGVQYTPWTGTDGSLVILSSGPCIGDVANGAFEQTDGGWPNSGTGTTIVFQNAQTSLITQCYWFAGYAYYGAPGVFSLTAGKFGGMMADDGVPPVQDAIADYGQLGFNTVGYSPCVAGGGGVNGPIFSGGGSPPPVLATPISIYRSHGDWMFRLANVQRAELASVTLVIGNQQIPATHIDQSGPTSALAYLSYPDIPQQTAPRLLVSTRSGSHFSFPLLVRDKRNVDSKKLGPSILVRLRPGALRWTPTPLDARPDLIGHRPLVDVPVNDSLLLRLFEDLGITSISKTAPYAADCDSFWLDRRGVRIPVPPHERHSYLLSLPRQELRVPALQMLLEQPAVDSAWVDSSRIIMRSSACDTDAKNDSKYLTQWELQSSNEFQNTLGIMANYAWCANRGSGPNDPSILWLIDCPVNYQHPDLIGQLAPDLPPQPEALSGPLMNHGVETAVLAIGAINGTGMVGVAPGAKLYPFQIRPGDPNFDHYNAILDYLNYIESHGTPMRDVVSMSFGLTFLDDPYKQSLAGKFAELGARNFPMFAARQMPDDFPADQPSVCAVGGSREYAFEDTCGPPSPVRAPCSDFASLPTFYTPFYESDPAARGTSFSTAIAAAGALIVMQCGYNSVLQDVYGELARETSEYGRIVVSDPCATTGINDISSFSVSGQSYSLVVNFRITDVTGIDHITICTSRSCKGPFDLRDTFTPHTNGWYSRPEPLGNGGKYYVLMQAYDRNLNYAAYQDSVDDQDMEEYPPPDEPGNVSVQLVGTLAARLSWDRVTGQDLRYYVIRSVSGGFAKCGLGTEWGTYSYAYPADQGGTCGEGLPNSSQCLYEDDLVPGGTYTYRVATVSTAGLGWCDGISTFSDPVTIHVSSTASIQPSSRDLADRIEIQPTPVTAGGVLRLSAESTASGLLEVNMYDASGRSVLDGPPSYPLRPGHNEIALSGFSEHHRSGQTSGVYFLTVRENGTRRLTRKVVVVR